MNRLMVLTLAVGLGACSSATQPDTPEPTPELSGTDNIQAMLAAGARVEIVRFEPAQLELMRGDSTVVRTQLLDAAGNAVHGVRMRLIEAPGTDVDAVAEDVRDAHLVRALAPAQGNARLFVAHRTAQGNTGWKPVGELPVTVRDYPLARVEIDRPQYRAYVGTTLDLSARPITTRDTEHAQAEIAWSSATPDIVRVTPPGEATFLRAGTAVLEASSMDKSATIRFDVAPNPVRTVRMPSAGDRVRTGDVVRLPARALNASGNAVDDARVLYTLEGAADDAAQVFDDGAFVASDPGTYTVVASAGEARATTTVEVAPRDVRQETTLVGQGPAGTATSDLWVFEGVDGRDYAYTGTMNAATVFAWDVTDPANPVKTDSVTLDGRRINDVKISEDRTLAIATSEGASNRRNGFTLLDISDPAHPTKITHYTENVTGGVHNVWIDGDIVYTVHNGTSELHIVDISDRANPVEIARWGVDKEDKVLHDVGVWDGLAYLSYWDDGLIILDVGNGVKGGSPSNPQFVSQYKYKYDIGGQMYGNTHHAYPYTNEAGQRYVFLGDEIFGCPGCENPRGYIHVIDVNDLDNPREVAQYELPKAGTHNLWVEDDRLYIAYYNAGLRVVDVSGELRGDLLEQGREIAVFKTDLPGDDEDQTMAWGPQPYKGNVFVSDLRSGLWAVKVEPQATMP